MNSARPPTLSLSDDEVGSGGESVCISSWVDLDGLFLSSWPGRFFSRSERLRGLSVFIVNELFWEIESELVRGMMSSSSRLGERDVSFDDNDEALEDFDLYRGRAPVGLSRRPWEE